MSTSTAHDAHLYDPDRHDNQIVAVFEDRAAAERARDALVQAGSPTGSIEIIDQPASTAQQASENGTVGDQILGAFMGLFSSNHDHDYAHAVERGHAMLVLTPQAGADRHQMIEALEQNGPVDFDAKLEEWRQAGYDKDGTPATTPAPGERRQAQPEATTSTSRVRSYLAERP